MDSRTPLSDPSGNPEALRAPRDAPRGRPFALRGRGPRPRGRQRRRQEHARQDPGRRLRRLGGKGRARGPLRAPAQPPRRRGARHRLHPPGAGPRRPHERGRQPLPRARALAVLSAAWTTAPSRRRRALWLERLGVDVDVSLPVEELPVAVQQSIEIARALSMDARVLVMDEPTSALTVMETRHLFERIEQLKREGRAVLFISHKMEEIYRIADRIAVLRDGQLVGTRPAAELGRGELVTLDGGTGDHRARARGRARRRRPPRRPRTWRSRTRLARTSPWFATCRSR